MISSISANLSNLYRRMPAGCQQALAQRISSVARFVLNHWVASSLAAAALLIGFLCYRTLSHRPSPPPPPRPDRAGGSPPQADPAGRPLAQDQSRPPSASPPPQDPPPPPHSDAAVEPLRQPERPFASSNECLNPILQRFSTRARARVSLTASQQRAQEQMLRTMFIWVCFCIFLYQRRLGPFTPRSQSVASGAPADGSPLLLAAALPAPQSSEPPPPLAAALSAPQSSEPPPPPAARVQPAVSCAPVAGSPPPLAAASSSAAPVALPPLSREQQAFVTFLGPAMAPQFAEAFVRALPPGTQIQQNQLGYQVVFSGTRNVEIPELFGIRLHTAEGNSSQVTIKRNTCSFEPPIFYVTHSVDGFRGIIDQQLQDGVLKSTLQGLAGTSALVVGNPVHLDLTGFSMNKDQISPILRARSVTWAPHIWISSWVDLSRSFDDFSELLRNIRWT